MPESLSILCIHGVGHGDVDPALVPSWTTAIAEDLRRWRPDLAIDFEFLRYGASSITLRSQATTDPQAGFPSA